MRESEVISEETLLEWQDLADPDCNICLSDGNVWSCPEGDGWPCENCYEIPCPDCVESNLKTTQIRQTMQCKCGEGMIWFNGELIHSDTMEAFCWDGYMTDRNTFTNTDSHTECQCACHDNIWLECDRPCSDPSIPKNDSQIEKS